MNLQWLVIITQKFIVSIRVHSSCCIFCGFSQTYHDVYLPFCIMHNSLTALHDVFLAILNSGIPHEISFWKCSIHLICYTVKQKIKISLSALLISGRTLFALFRHAILSGHFLSDISFCQATSCQTCHPFRPLPDKTHVNSHLALVVASPPSSHLSSGGTRDPGCDTVDPILQLCPFSQSPRRGGGGQLSIWQVPWAPGPRFPPHCQYPHAWWQAFPEGMQNGHLSRKRKVGLRRVTEVKSVNTGPY